MKKYYGEFGILTFDVNRAIKMGILRYVVRINQLDRRKMPCDYYQLSLGYVLVATTNHHNVAIFVSYDGL